VDSEIIGASSASNGQMAPLARRIFLCVATVVAVGAMIGRPQSASRPLTADQAAIVLEVARTGAVFVWTSLASASLAQRGRVLAITAPGRRTPGIRAEDGPCDARRGRARRFSLAGGMNPPVPPLLTRHEAKALHYIINNVIAHTVGMDQQKLIRYMNDVSVYEKVVAALRAAHTIKLTGTIAEDQFH
jgi:hypothetical protein